MGFYILKVEADTEEEAKVLQRELNRAAKEAGYATRNPFLLDLLRNVARNAKQVMPRKKKGVV